MSAVLHPSRPRWLVPGAAALVAVSLAGGALLVARSDGSDGPSGSTGPVSAARAVAGAPVSAPLVSAPSAQAQAQAQAEARAAAEAKALADAQALAEAQAAAEAEAQAQAAAEAAAAEAAAAAAARAEADRAAVLGVQQRLAELGYSPGTADGRVGGRTSSAILAFQKMEGLSTDGDVGPELIERLAQPQASPAPGTTGSPRIQVDLGRQVVTVVTGSGTKVFNASTGNGEAFDWPDGTPGLAYTPTGTFSVLRRIDGMDEGPLGAMYRPLYFYDGWAVHGSGFVPAYPASHGCVRVSNADQDWIWENVPNGAAVTVT